MNRLFSRVCHSAFSFSCLLDFIYDLQIGDYLKPFPDWFKSVACANVACVDFHEYAGVSFAPMPFSEC